MRVSIFLAAAIATLVNADESSSIIGYFSPSWKAGLWLNGAWSSTAASLASINTKAATYHVGCVKGAPKTDCDMENSMTIIQGPETVNFDATWTAIYSDKTDPNDYTVTESYDGSLKSSTESASCTMSIGYSGTEIGASISSTTSTKQIYTTAPISTSYYQLTVTAG